MASDSVPLKYFNNREAESAHQDQLVQYANIVLHYPQNKFMVVDKVHLERDPK